MSKQFKGTINIDIQDSVPDWEPYAQPLPPEDAPNVLYIVLDDVGFSAMESFGGQIETPNIKRRTRWRASPKRRRGSQTPVVTSQVNAR